MSASWTSDPPIVAALTARSPPLHHNHGLREESVRVNRTPTVSVSTRINTRYCPEVAAAAWLAAGATDRPGWLRRGEGWVETPVHGALPGEIGSTAYNNALALVDFATLRRRVPAVPVRFLSASTSRCHTCGSPAPLYGHELPGAEEQRAGSSPTGVSSCPLCLQRYRELGGQMPGELQAGQQQHAEQNGRGGAVTTYSRWEMKDASTNTLCDATTQTEDGEDHRPSPLASAVPPLNLAHMASTSANAVSSASPGTTQAGTQSDADPLSSSLQTSGNTTTHSAGGAPGKPQGRPTAAGSKQKAAPRGPGGLPPNPGGPSRAPKPAVGARPKSANPGRQQTAPRHAATASGGASGGSKKTGKGKTPAGRKGAGDTSVGGGPGRSMSSSKGPTSVAASPPLSAWPSHLTHQGTDEADEYSDADSLMAIINAEGADTFLNALHQERLYQHSGGAGPPPDAGWATADMAAVLADSALDGEGSLEMGSSPMEQAQAEGGGEESEVLDTARSHSSLESLAELERVIEEQHQQLVDRGVIPPDSQDNSLGLMPIGGVPATVRIDGGGLLMTRLGESESESRGGLSEENWGGSVDEVVARQRGRDAAAPASDPAHLSSFSTMHPSALLTTDPALSLHAYAHGGAGGSAWPFALSSSSGGAFTTCLSGATGDGEGSPRPSAPTPRRMRSGSDAVSPLQSPKPSVLPSDSLISSTGALHLDHSVAVHTLDGLGAADDTLEAHDISGMRGGRDQSGAGRDDTASVDQSMLTDASSLKEGPQGIKNPHSLSCSPSRNGSLHFSSEPPPLDLNDPAHPDKPKLMKPSPNRPVAVRAPVGGDLFSAFPMAPMHDVARQSLLHQRVTEWQRTINSEDGGEASKAGASGEEGFSDSGLPSSGPASFEDRRPDLPFRPLPFAGAVIADSALKLSPRSAFTRGLQIGRARAELSSTPGETMEANGNGP